MRMLQYRYRTVPAHKSEIIIEDDYNSSDNSFP